jgi:hypothetical protein
MRRTLGCANLGLFAASTLIVTGCASMRPYDPGPGKRVAASVAQDSYLSGESVNVTIANLSDVTLFYPGSFCKTALQRRVGATWTTLSEPSTGCPTELGFLEPGQAVVHQFRLPKGVPVGMYRFTIAMPVPDELVPEPVLLTPAFKVESAQAQ